ncbi:HAD-like domain-containing protein [Cynara cardunculus var. scolymus]|uniref:Mitochondrial import inner membrane translocase subunit TIM50 n=1 Tax=Cynara cardunculus var. scolymus TaxID=59895 RepID=A0A103XZU1_CYNCS|nr:HAD-like domain-containing protein [Cynara cardunculus var. scolymus]
MASKDSKLKNISVVSDHDTSSGDDDKKETRVDISFDKLNLGRKKKLLVIPLAGILVHRAYRFKPTTIPTHRSPDFSYGKFLVYKRPFCEGFLKFCFERFQVGLWSSALEIKRNAHILDSCPNTSISIDDYDPNNKEDDFLGPDGALRAFLDGLVEAEDVPTYVRNHPFGEPAITPSHSDWDYYNTVIRSMGKKKTTDRKN